MIYRWNNFEALVTYAKTEDDCPMIQPGQINNTPILYRFTFQLKE
jgi:hypothetical protein